LSWGVYSYNSVLSRFKHDKPHQLTDSNRLHHSKCCSNHSIEPHHGHLTSRRMEDQHSQHSTSQTQHHKDGKTYMTLKTTGLSNTTNHKNPILNMRLWFNYYMRLVYIRERKHIGIKWSRVTCLALPLAAAYSLGRQVLEDSQSRWRLMIAIENK
jgi:hypothetical protein